MEGAQLLVPHLSRDRRPAIIQVARELFDYDNAAGYLAVRKMHLDRIGRHGGVSQPRIGHLTMNRK